MHIGLYSELARRDINVIRTIASKRIEVISNKNLREFRQNILLEGSGGNSSLLSISDIYSLSEFRDLFFHVQESQFSIKQIAHCLQVLGLKFCGFENKAIVNNFANVYPKSADLYNLNAWDKFERLHPLSFRGMYQFWCQKEI